MKNLILFLLITLGAVGCSLNEKELKEEANRDSDRMLYFKDYRTGICFSAWSSNGIIFGERITYVPCTEAVEKMLLNKREDDTCH